MHENQPLRYFKSQEDADAETGYFQLQSLRIDVNLGEILTSYLKNEGLVTWLGQNKAGTSSNLHTVNFQLRNYSREKYQKNPFFMLIRGGAYGSYKMYLKDRDVKTDHAIEQLEKLRDIEERTPSMNQLYFWIVQKYSSQIRTMEYSLENPFGGLADLPNSK